MAKSEFSLISKKVIGTPDKTGWAQIYDFKPELTEKLALRGHLHAIFATANIAGDIDTITIGRELISRFHEEYYGNETSTAFNALKDAVEKVIQEFKKDYNWEIEVAVAAYVGNSLITVVANGGQAILFRNNSLARILESKAGDVASASGYPSQNDIFAIGTSHFFENISREFLKDSLKTMDLDKTVETLTPKIHSLKGSASLGVVFMQFCKGTPFRTKEKESDKYLKEERKKTSIRGKTVAFLDFLIEKIPQKKIYVKKQEGEKKQGQRKTVIPVGIIFLTLLVISIGFGIRQKVENDKKGKYEEHLSKAEHNIEESLNLFSLNPERSRDLFVESRLIIDDLLAQGIKDKRIEELKIKIDENEGNILGEHKSSAELFIDLSIYKDGFKPSYMMGWKDELYLLDKEGEIVIRVDVETKKTKTLAGPDDIDNPISLTAGAGGTYLMSSKGIYEITNETDLVIKSDWGENSMLFSYAGNLYVIEKDSSKIYKYSPSGDGFSGGSEWLKEDVDLSDTVDMAVDGSIWTTDTKSLTKLTRGLTDRVNFDDTFDEISGIRSIYTNEEIDDIYLLSKDERKVYIFEKEGVYKAKYLEENLGNAQNIYVTSDQDQLIFSQEDGKIFSIKIAD